jgi:hypothetical protein
MTGGIRVCLCLLFGAVVTFVIKLVCPIEKGAHEFNNVATRAAIESQAQFQSAHHTLTLITIIPSTLTSSSILIIIFYLIVLS